MYKNIIFLTVKLWIFRVIFIYIMWLIHKMRNFTWHEDLKYPSTEEQSKRKTESTLEVTYHRPLHSWDNNKKLTCSLIMEGSKTERVVILKWNSTHPNNSDSATIKGFAADRWKYTGQTKDNNTYNFIYYFYHGEETDLVCEPLKNNSIGIAEMTYVVFEGNKQYIKGIGKTRIKSYVPLDHGRSIHCTYSYTTNVTTIRTVLSWDYTNPNNSGFLDTKEFPYFKFEGFDERRLKKEYKAKHYNYKFSSKEVLNLTCKVIKYYNREIGYAFWIDEENSFQIGNKTNKDLQLVLDAQHNYKYLTCIYSIDGKDVDYYKVIFMCEGVCKVDKPNDKEKKNRITSTTKPSFVSHPTNEPKRDQESNTEPSSLTVILLEVILPIVIILVVVIIVAVVRCYWIRRIKKKSQEGLHYDYATSQNIMSHYEARALAAANKRLGEEDFVPSLPPRPRHEESDYDYACLPDFRNRY